MPFSSRNPLSLARCAVEAGPLAGVFLPDRLELVEGPSALRRAQLGQVVAALWLGIITLLTAVLLAPEAAALRNAAGGGGQGGGFGRFVTFINRLADWVIPVGAAFSVLWLVWGGSLLMRGDSRAGQVLGGVAVGLAVVLLAKPIAA